MIEKAITDYNKDDYLTRIDENTLIMSLTLFYYCFFESSNPISDVFDITTLYEKEDKNEIILNFLSEVLKNFKEEQLNEILSVENFRVYSQIRYYLKNINKAPLPTFKIPISFQKYFYYVEIKAGSFRPQRTIKVIRKY